MNDALTARAAREFREDRERTEHVRPAPKLAAIPREVPPPPESQEDYGADARQPPLEEDSAAEAQSHDPDKPYFVDRFKPPVRTECLPAVEPLDAYERRMAASGRGQVGDRSSAGKFKLEPFEAIHFEPSKEWLVKSRIPRQGVGALYGAPQSFKSFVAFDGAMRIALGWEWMGRKTCQAPAVYIAAEGAAGLRKRKIGFEKAHAGRLPANVPFLLIPAAPNFGAEKGDLEALIAAVAAARVAPGLIVIDTLAQSLGGGDENGVGMMTFVANATELANRLKCCVLVVHHSPLADERRMRGHTSLHGAVDVQILTGRHMRALATTLTIEKMKDEESHISLTAHLSRIVIGTDEDGDEVSTLIVDRIEEGAAPQPKAPSTSIPRSRRLLMDMAAAAIEAAGKDFRSFPDGPMVHAVKDQCIRDRYYARIAEKAESGEDADKLAARQRKGFNRAIAAALAAKDLVARERDGTRFIWLP
jgi:hypothetical protein